VVFNPLPWTRDGLVQVNANSFPATTGVRCADTQQRARVARSDTDALEGPPKIVTFVAKDIPPLGYRTYVFEDVPPTEPAPALLVSETNNIIESPAFKAVLDPQNGRIASLVDNLGRLPFRPAVIIVSHEWRVLGHAGRAWRLREGRLVETVPEGHP